MTTCGNATDLDLIFGRLTGAAVFVLDPEREGNLGRSARRMGFRVFSVDGEAVNSKRELLPALARVFSFPDYFGHNWDALSECIRDLSWLPRANFVLCFRNANHLLRLGRRDFATLIGILGDTTFSWKAEGVVFSVVLLGGTDVASAVQEALRQSA